MIKPWHLGALIDSINGAKHIEIAEKYNTSPVHVTNMLQKLCDKILGFDGYSLTVKTRIRRYKPKLLETLTEINNIDKDILKILLED